ncbi:hypothetical protein ACJX0J_010992, partial [Zea mays]
VFGALFYKFVTLKMNYFESGELGMEDLHTAFTGAKTATSRTRPEHAEDPYAIAGSPSLQIIHILLDFMFSGALHDVHTISFVCFHHIYVFHAGSRVPSLER